MVPAQVKAVIDASGSLWKTGALVGKPAGVFFSTATQGGGQESTALTFLTQLTHHGMMFVPIGYSSPLLFNNEEVCIYVPMPLNSKNTASSYLL